MLSAANSFHIPTDSRWEYTDAGQFQGPVSLEDVALVVDPSFVH